MTDHPVNGIDDVVHQRVRLGILAITREARKVEFGFLRSTLDLTAGNLSQHLTVLDKAGLITVEKGYEGRRGRTWVELTKAGSMISNATFKPFVVFSCVALLYFVLCFPVSLYAKNLERKINVARR